MYWHRFNQAPVCCWRRVFPQQCSLTCKNMLGERFLTRNKTGEETNVFISVSHQQNRPGIYDIITIFVSEYNMSFYGLFVCSLVF